MSYNLADLFEAIADAVPDREALIVGERRLTYSQLEERANRLANHLLACGVRPGEHVGLQLMNGSEYLEGMIAAFKIRAIPINVNFRYVEAELRYLFDNADLVALVYHRQFASRVAAVAPEAPLIERFLVVEDGSDEQPAPGSEPYEDVLAKSNP